MAQVHGNAEPNAAAPGERAGLGRLIGAGLILVGLVLLALGAYLGPYSYATSTPGKLTVETCTVDYKYRSSTSSSSRKRTKTKWCYGTFTATNGTTKDLNAELRSDALYQRGDVIEALKTGDTSYQQDHGWVGAIAVGCVWWFGALIPLALGLFGTATGFAFGGASDVRRSKQAASQGLLGAVYVLIAVGVIGFVISLLVMLFA
ncbi:hypothetical protein [Streptomyces sp. TRM68367]|uniref:hypothetical protein n=1 Tax=Streptomyces sp. TRM68367 TaxID=2758415 RepID=UPI00165ADCF0|nr:hypothetical protein [Streptomyces sp. TRM68367]MBC9729912.1 hypothetical protein [Streptomyces sp. TRM68367]